MTLENVLVFFDTLAWLSGIVLIFSKLQRKLDKLRTRQVVTGLILGFASILLMLDPLQISPGVQIDGRNMLIGFAGAFCGPLGAIAALFMTATVRIYIGGIGVLSAISSMAFCAAAGLLWAEFEKRQIIKLPWRWPLLAGMMAMSIPLLLLVPSPTGTEAFMQGGLILLLVYTVGVMFFGPLLTSEIKYAQGQKDLRNASRTDPLTGALNRRGLQLNFDTMVQRRPKRDGYRGLAMIIIDVDHFKEVNDHYGHDAGDLVLQTLVETVVSNVRSYDLTARLGGDEFAVCVFGVTLERAEQLTKNLHEKLKFQIAPPGSFEPVDVTVSIGAVYTQEPMPNMADVLTLADENLLSAKRSGRNRYIFEATETYALSYKTRSVS